MFDNRAGTSVSAQPPPVLQFVSVEIMPTGGGRLSVSLAGTYLDEKEMEFFNGELAGARVASLDEALVVIRNAVAEALGVGEKKEGH